MSTATTGEGLCDGCAVARGMAEPAPRPKNRQPGRLRSPLGLSRAVVVLLVLVAVADLLALYTQGISPLLAEPVDPVRTDTGWTPFTMTETLRADVVILTGVVFLVWFHRVRVNAGVLAQGNHRGGVAWAVVSWFIPIANIWIPRGVAVDIWRASTPRNTEVPGRGTNHRVINAWWAGWLVSQLVGQFAGAVYEDADTVDAMRTAACLLLAAAVVDIAAALLAVLFVRRLTAMQQEAVAQARQASTV
ncbi:DUF4328 domain-containing protein [Streptomyces meridianus]|uniref:DUF4328 domain-containing protein n=1 Tax=Streptomyces meridianus TaxID=2938945 RepID=A0ABT0XDN8_9ACTN|nr:DUF4328 domain-containing protein [Streptomyces meridianus]MCM2579889.1 DUF4328 domain-containing protein [Streptomyces meridianus]